jgi:hypothetical protein
VAEELAPVTAAAAAVVVEPASSPALVAPPAQQPTDEVQHGMPSSEEPASIGEAPAPEAVRTAETLRDEAPTMGTELATAPSIVLAAPDRLDRSLGVTLLAAQDRSDLAPIVAPGRSDAALSVAPDRWDTAPSVATDGSGSSPSVAPDLADSSPSVVLAAPDRHDAATVAILSTPDGVDEALLAGGARLSEQLQLAPALPTSWTSRWLVQPSMTISAVQPGVAPAAPAPAHQTPAPLGAPAASAAPATLSFAGGEQPGAATALLAAVCLLAVWATLAQQAKLRPAGVVLPSLAPPG